MSKYEWRSSLYIEDDNVKYETQIEQRNFSVEEGSLQSSRSKVHEELSNYTISKIKTTKEESAYGRPVLVNIAKLLGISTIGTKEKLANSILNAWKERYPEDFSEES